MEGSLFFPCRQQNPPLPALPRCTVSYQPTKSAKNHVRDLGGLSSPILKLYQTASGEHKQSEERSCHRRIPQQRRRLQFSSSHCKQSRFPIPQVPNQQPSKAA